jgi:hypothetical protein
MKWLMLQPRRFRTLPLTQTRTQNPATEVGALQDSYSVDYVYCVLCSNECMYVYPQCYTYA